MTALVMLAVGEFRVLYWCRPMPACISGNKRWHPDGYLIWCPRTGFRPAQKDMHATPIALPTQPKFTCNEPPVPISNDVFTPAVTDTKTETETEKMGTEPNGNLCWYLPLCSVNTSTHSIQVILICICLGVQQCKHTISLSRFLRAELLAVTGTAYCLTTKLREGNVFSHVCLWVPT